MKRVRMGREEKGSELRRDGRMGMSDRDMISRVNIFGVYISLENKNNNRIWLTQYLRDVKVTQ